MTFSLRTLLAVVLVAAIFAAALVYHTMAWAIAIVTFSMTALMYGTLHLIGFREQRGFWVGFSAVGWIYALMAVGVCGRWLSAYLPSSIVVIYIEWRQSGEPVRFLNPFSLAITHCMFGLLSAALAGAISWTLLQHKAKKRLSE